MMERESLDIDKRLSDNKSLVLRYQVMLKETMDKGAPTERRTDISFRILDELIAHTGVFREIISEIRNELKAAVYSDQLTTDGHESVGAPVIQKVPFFTLVRRIMHSRDEKNEELQKNLEVVMKKLFSKQQEYEESLMRISDQQASIESLKEEIENLKENIAEEKMRLKEVEANFQKERKEFSRKENNLQLDIQDLKDELEELTKERDILRPYKSGYDKLQKAFQADEVETKFMIRDRRTPVVATRRAHLITSIDAALRLEEQLLQVQNLTIEEFDQHLESHRSQITLDLDSQLGFLDGESRLRQLEAERADVELMRSQRRFNDNVEQLNTELGLLRQHTTMLKEQLQQLEQAAKTQGKEPPKQILKKGGRKKVDPVADDDEFLGDPFVVHERVFSKYAAMLYTSSNAGKTFSEFKDAKYCPACGEKTVVCPHKIGHQDMVFQVPFNTTHVKITRPKVKINSKVVDRALGLSNVPSEDSRGPLFSRESMKMIGLTSSMASMPPATPGSQFSEDSSGDARFKHSFNKLWEDYKSREPLERRVSRPIEQDRLMSIIEQFWATVLWDDEYAMDDEGFACIIDNMYLFFQERYIKQDIAFLAIHDFISALMVATPTYQILQIFCHCLVNNFDGAAFRYLLLLSDFVDMVEWKHVEDFRGFFSTIFPFLNEDDVETFQIGYISYSENKISKHLVMDYVMYIMLKYREPRFLEMENRLLQSPQQEFGSMTEREFIAVLENIIPLTHERLARRLYQESELATQQENLPPDLVPLSKLSHIASFIALLQISGSIRQELTPNILKNRELNIDEHERGELEQKFKDSDQVTEPLRWTFSRFRDLAQNMARSAEFRQGHGNPDLME